MSEVDEALTEANPVDILTSGKITKDDIGKTVYLSNSAITCQEWRIADVNHDNTSGTVDLFPKYALQNRKDHILFDADISKCMYSDASIRTYLNTTVLNGFTAEIQNAMKVQAFPSNGETLYDKVKCPSLDEVGCNKDCGEYAPIVEGTIYPIFGTQQSNPNTLAIYKAILSKYSSDTCNYWTRSKENSRLYSIWIMQYNGTANILCGSSTLKCIACIRF